ncbi:dihydropteroate synthase [Gryllotalpicola ginsengisoli]|uniref:dihydropteroate synthase n=1 Tax=Gryllotalpicola ginsengisoli TaxID=444608 RepID=UPI0003B45703|nr:dihydropteroate synthase [Gryllotalpicola ginsengisoli]
MTVIMGVLNVTPDSFSDGGRFESVDAAVAHAVELTEQGADLIDVGGESTRPGAPRVPVEQELGRVLPVIEQLTARGIRTSIDTMNAQTARAAVAAGTEWINDVSGGQADPEMFAAAAELECGFMLSHWRGHSADMNALAHYGDAAFDVRDELRRQVDKALDAGVHGSRLIVDPGLGFAKDHGHNWRILGRLDVLEELGYPVLIGASRKRFLGRLLPDDAPIQARDLPTAVISALAAHSGVWGVRVHDVVSTRVALAVVDAWKTGAR